MKGRSGRRSLRVAIVLATALALIDGRAALAQRESRTLVLIQLATDRDRYAPGDEVIVTLTNRSAAPVWYNTCPRELQYEEPEGWVTVRARPAEGEDCIAVAYHLAPGASVQDPIALDRTLPPGRYRLRFAWVAEGALTEPFRVTQRPTSEE